MKKSCVYSLCSLGDGYTSNMLRARFFGPILEYYIVGIILESAKQFIVHSQATLIPEWL